MNCKLRKHVLCAPALHAKVNFSSGLQSNIQNQRKGKPLSSQCSCNVVQLTPDAVNFFSLSTNFNFCLLFEKT